jgi:hypothetical protein
VRKNIARAGSVPLYARNLLILMAVALPLLSASARTDTAGPDRTAVLTGTVTDADTGAPLDGVRIVLSGMLDTGEGLARTARTDRQGVYRLDDLPPGRFMLSVEHRGHDGVEVLVVLTADTITRRDAALRQTAAVLEELVVTGTALDSEARLQSGFVSLDAASLSAIPGIVEADPLRALRALPGVSAASDISSGLYIRGGGPDQTLILMDGVPVYNPTHAFGLFSTFNNDVVSGIDLFKGAYPAAYGGRLSSVLDVNMRQAETTRTVRGELGVSLIAARGLAEGRLGEDRWLVAGRRTYLEPLLDAIRTPEDPIPSYYFYDANVSYQTRRLGGTTTLTLYHGRDDVFADLATDTRFSTAWGNTVASLRHEGFLTDNIEGSLQLYSSFYESTTDAEILATPFDVRNDLHDQSVAGRLAFEAGRGHRLTIGLGFSRFDLSYFQSFNLDNLIDYRRDPREISGYLEDRWYLGPRTTLRLGLRARHISDGDRLLYEPRLSMSHELDPAWRVKLGFGRYNQYLQLVTTEGFTAADFYLPSDETIDLGHSRQIVAGVEWTPSRAQQVSLEIYDTDLSNLVVLDNRTPVDRNRLTAEDVFITEGAGFARGIELLLRRDVGTITGWLGYTLGTTRRRFAELNGGKEFSAKYDRRHDLSLLLSRRTGAWTLGAAFQYGTGQAFTPAAARYQLRDPATGRTDNLGQVLPADRNSARLHPYHRLDLSARRPIRLLGRPAELVVEVFNVYSRRNEWFVQYETDEETTTATMVRMLPIIPSVGVNIEF